MAKIQRQTQKIFAGNATSEELAVFGSMKTGNPIYTDNIEELQSADYEQGWSSAIVADEAPFLEEMNAVQYGLSKQLAYLFQNGIPEWDEGTTYYKNTGFCQVDGIIYQSLTDENLGNNPQTDTTNWKKYLDNLNLANIDLSNLSEAGEARFTNKANIDLSNLSEASVYNSLSPNATQLFRNTSGYICTIAGRNYYKVNNEPAIIAIVNVNGYIQPFLVGWTETSVQQYNDYATTPSKGTVFTYNGKTLYFNGGSGAMPFGNTVSNGANIIRLSGNYTEFLTPARILLEMYLNGIRCSYPTIWDDTWAAANNTGVSYEVHPNGSVEMWFRYFSANQNEEIVLNFPIKLAEVDFYIVTGYERSHYGANNYPLIVSRTQTSITFVSDSNTMNYFYLKGKAA